VSTAITPINFNGQVVATYPVLAKYLGATEKQLNMNFSNNKGRFIEGKHYFKLSHSDTNDIGVLNYQGLRGVTVWTERGCARHSKILQTDEAWELWEDMEDSYFSIRKPVIPQNFSEALRLAADLQDKNSQLEEQKKINAPKVEFANIISDSGDSRAVRYWVKAMKDENCLTVREKDVFEWLVMKKYIYRSSQGSYLPKASAESSGLKYFTTDTKIFNGKSRMQLKITGKGEFKLTAKVVKYFSENETVPC